MSNSDTWVNKVLINEGSFDALSGMIGGGMKLAGKAIVGAAKGIKGLVDNIDSKSFAGSQGAKNIDDLSAKLRMMKVDDPSFIPTMFTIASKLDESQGNKVLFEKLLKIFQDEIDRVIHMLESILSRPMSTDEEDMAMKSLITVYNLLHGKKDGLKEFNKVQINGILKAITDYNDGKITSLRNDRLKKMSREQQFKEKQFKDRRQGDKSSQDRPSEEDTSTIEELLKKDIKKLTKEQLLTVIGYYEDYIKRNGDDIFGSTTDKYGFRSANFDAAERLHQAGVNLDKYSEEYESRV